MNAQTPIQHEHSPRLPQAIAKLQALLHDRLSTVESVLAQHGRDESWHNPELPDAVAFPINTAEVSAIAKICSAHKIPMIPFGAGSSVEGALIPTMGGIVVSTLNMNQVLAVHPDNFDCVVQPGLSRKALNQYLKGTGLFFPIDPGADASIGGMTATRASGTNAMRYGTMAEVVRGLEVVLADGRIIRTGSRARKSSAGYDLTHLFIGHEGTLGLVTEITLRLSPLPESATAATCRFPSLESAVQTSVALMQAGIPVARIELLDELMVDAVNQYSKMDMPLLPHLFFEFQGSPSRTKEDALLVQDLCQEFGGDEFQWTSSPEEMTQLWKARHNCAYACMAYRRPRKLMTTDVCVPLNNLTECILSSRADAEAQGITAPILGHVGDGNFHMVLLVDPDNADEVQRAEGVNTRLIERAIACGGTSTGEHGVGLGKRAYMQTEHGEALDVMRSIKQTLDPNNLLNPGKVLPD